ncbi:MAG TPA: type II toxin-antitoxin system RelE/ParE family toxin [Pseudomonas sp.]|uniref:type II toxin-antitoxin system RelE/ParE family toxin n=1 Tax=Pseudomonas sp. TaxID=306 RepID=UPI002B527EC7|nr:type II toxin-antitoxin system RelE/ParE family toxin [Pseudomonas sp.]HWH86346.1 type II toxin-antitoxin system RelE/ParE family toxin [Pseudomonas sp.]
MITSFKHKGLKAFYTSASTRGIQAVHAPRLLRMLSALDVAAKPADMDLPGYRLHPLKGDLAGFWSISVSGNWRVIFRFCGSDVELLDYLDYH